MHRPRYGGRSSVVERRHKLEVAGANPAPSVMGFANPNINTADMKEMSLEAWEAITPQPDGKCHCPKPESDSGVCRRCGGLE